MRIEKSHGVTDTENFLSKLCEDTFLKVWSYPNPIKDDNDELCDLIAVFENHLFIFFDRNSDILNSADDDKIEIVWKRWNKKVIEKQIKTALGAEKYILSGRKIYLDCNKNQEFPMNIDPKKIKIHKFIVAHGAKKACEKYFKNDSKGSLIINYTNNPFDGYPETPFLVRLLRKNPVHVFDSYTLPILFKELDTFYDFTSYINEKEKAISKYDIIYPGEEELLAYYISNFDESNNRHYMTVKDKKCTSIVIEEGYWYDYINSEEFKTKTIENQRSYAWDKLIQKTCQNALDNTLMGNGDLFNGNNAIREMAKEPRFLRRILSDHMMKAINEFPISNQDVTRKITYMPSFYKEKGYVFLQLHVRDKIQEHREVRQKLLEIACASAKKKLRHLKRVIGISIDSPKYTEEIAEDFLYLDCENWSDEDIKYYDELNQGFKFFETKNLREHEETASEFPKLYKKPNKIGRNEKCPCGSGKKYKKCCLNNMR